MKKMKFSEEFVQLILSGEKTSTWIMFDDQDFEVGDDVLFIRRPELVPFAKAKVNRVFTKKLKQMTEKDMEGHEKLATKHGMFTTFTGYEGKPVNSETEVKFLRFQILEWL